MTSSPIPSLATSNIYNTYFDLVVFHRYLTGVLSAMVMSNDEELTVSRSKMEAVESFVRENNLPR
jgi:hypothetical protein